MSHNQINTSLAKAEAFFVLPTSANGKKASPKVELAQLMQVIQTMEGTLGQLKTGKDPIGKVFPLNPQAPSNEGPSNGQMQKALGELMSLLTELQCKIAIFSNQNEQTNTAIGQGLIKDAAAQMKRAETQLQNLLKDEQSEGFWSIFGEVVECVVGAIVSGMALATGQPELAADHQLYSARGLWRHEKDHRGYRPCLDPRSRGDGNS